MTSSARSAWVVQLPSKRWPSIATRMVGDKEHKAQPSVSSLGNLWPPPDGVRNQQTKKFRASLANTVAKQAKLHALAALPQSRLGHIFSASSPKPPVVMDRRRLRAVDMCKADYVVVDDLSSVLLSRHQAP